MTDILRLSPAFLRLKATVFSIVRDRKIKILEILILSVLPIMYLYFTYQDFSQLPWPSDPTVYLMAAITPGAPLRFIDRIMVYIGLRVSDIFFSPAYVAGMYYIAIINLLIITICIFWAYCKKGILAGLFAGVLLISAREFLRLATFIYADQTLALYALLAFIFFYSDYKNKVFDSAVIAGIFTAFACFSKIPGIAIFIPFFITILVERNWSKLIKLLTGFFIGIVFVFLAAFILFGWDALKPIFSEAIRMSATFFDVKGTIARYGSYVYSRPVSYFGLLVLEYYLPIFFSMVILIGAYRDRITRNLYFAAMSFIGILALFVVFSKIAAVSNNYIYPAIIFSSLGLALYLANILEKRNDALISKLDCVFTEKAKIIYAILCIVFVFVSLKFGILYYSDFINPMAKTTPPIISMVYPLIPLMMIGALMAIEYWSSRIVVLLFMILVSIWSPAYNGASAYDYVSNVDRPGVDHFYTAAPVLNQVPADKFSIYVEAWNKVSHSDRLMWIYAYFFNERKIDTGNISFITKPESLSADNIKGKHILTDNPALIHSYFPGATPVKSILWKDVQLTVMELPQ